MVKHPHTAKFCSSNHTFTFRPMEKPNKIWISRTKACSQPTDILAYWHPELDKLDPSFLEPVFPAVGQRGAVTRERWVGRRRTARRSRLSPWALRAHLPRRSRVSWARTAAGMRSANHLQNNVEIIIENRLSSCSFSSLKTSMTSFVG